MVHVEKIMSQAKPSLFLRAEKLFTSIVRFYINLMQMTFQVYLSFLMCSLSANFAGTVTYVKF